jgi:hypothetical protein
MILELWVQGFSLRVFFAANKLSCIFELETCIESLTISTNATQSNSGYVFMSKQHFLTLEMKEPAKLIISTSQCQQHSY